MRYVFGDYLLDTQRHELSRAGEPVPLRPKVFQVLAYLLAQRDRVVRKQELLEHLWPGQLVEDSAFNSYIMAVRKAIGDQRPIPQLLRTVRGYGYRFVAPVLAQEPASTGDGLSSTSPSSEPPSVPAHLSPPFPAVTSTTIHATNPDAPSPDGEYKHVTVLCCALAEVPARIVRSDPEVRYRLMQTAFRLAKELVPHYGGTLMSHAGDGFTAVFDAPMAQEDHARRAVMAALNLSQRLRQQPIPPTLTSRDDLAVRMGMHSGLAVVGRLGHAPQQSYTAIGDPTTLATRLQHRAAPGIILMSAATYQLVHGEMWCEPCGTLDSDQPPTAAVYAVRGPLQQPAGSLGPHPRVWSPFVGRTRELALLHDRLARARAGQGQVVALIGDPGMGKSRLLAEFRRRLLAAPVTWCVGHCRSYGQGTPYHPVLDVLRQLCGTTEGDATDAVTAAVCRCLQESGRAEEDEVALVCQLLDVPGEPEELARLSPQTRQSRTFALLRHLVLHAAAAANGRGGGEPALDRCDLGGLARVAGRMSGWCRVAAAGDCEAGVPTYLGRPFRCNAARLTPIARTGQPGDCAGGPTGHSPARRTHRAAGGDSGRQPLLLRRVSMARPGTVPPAHADGATRDGARGPGGAH